MSFVDRKKYLLRISNNTGAETISVLNLLDEEYVQMVDMVISFNCFSFHEGDFHPNSLSYFEKPFDTQKEAIQYYKEHKNEIEWKEYNKMDNQ